MKVTALLAAALLASTAALAQDKAKAPEAKAKAPEVKSMAAKSPDGKGKAAGEVVRLTATVEAIDQKTREVTLKGSKGNVITFVAGPEVKNLAQVSKGDIVTLDYAQAVAVQLKKTSAMPSRSVTETGKSAAPGQMPAAVAAREIRIVATVEAIDAAKSVVTLKGPEQTVDVKVKDPAILKEVKKGDNVEAVYVEAVAIKVEKGPAAPAKK